MHPSYKSKVNEFYQIIANNPTQNSLVKIGTLYFAFMLPDFPEEHLKRLAI